MLITPDVNLSEDLIEARNNGTLVIFAGAGVSVGPPSNLPTFKKLAKQIAGEALLRAKNEPYDRFLGRAERQGVKVRRRAQRRLSHSKSKPNQLHKGILSLFRSPNDIRLVTTNFDKHFSTAVTELFKTSIDIYRAPALPLGRNFQGIVYLHGCVDADPERLVLTDSDFGSAYITDGWATRFLLEMFSSYYTVLFVGYSHDDPVMRYLARGLSSELAGVRYALAPAGSEGHWEFLGIEPIVYPLNKGVKKHSALGDAITAWVTRARMGALDHERRIKAIVERPPPLNRIDSDYIESSLKKLETAPFFRHHARSPEWLRWAEDKGVLSTLFQPGETVNDIAVEIAHWFAVNYVYEHPNEALALIQRQRQNLSYVLWSSIVARLHRSPKPDSRTLAKWIAVIIDSAESHYSSQILNFILTDCHYPEDNSTALLLFEYLTKPRLELKPYFGFLPEEEKGKERVDVEITLLGDEYWLRESWKKVFLPNLEYYALKLEPIVTSYLQRAHNLLLSFELADERYDKFSYRRYAIEPHGHDELSEKLDILIDAARGLIEYMLEHEPNCANGVIEAWSNSEVPILKRLAIHGVAKSPRLTSDEKIIWILDKGWLYALGLKHEVFRLLSIAYPGASEPIRLQLLEQVELGPQGRETENHE